MAVLEGLLIGLAMIMFIGPVFFLLLKSTLDHGPKMGVSVALGIITSDIICVLLCLLGAKPFLENAENQVYIAGAGSLILLGMGLKYLLKPNVSTDTELQVTGRDFLAFYTKGIAVNLINPFVFAVWIGIIGLGETKYGGGYAFYLFIAAVLVGILCTDLSKVFFAQKIKRFVNEVYLTKVYRVFGIVMLGFGVRLVWYVVNHI